MVDSADLRERIRKALQSQRQQTVTILSSLLAVEDLLHHIPPVAVEEIAQHTGRTINEVWDTASFYLNFRFTPPNPHSMEVCWGPTCHLKGGQEIAQATLKALGLENDGDTADHKISFRFNTCLGPCAQAPVISVDHHLVGRCTPEEALRQVERLRKAEGEGH